MDELQRFTQMLNLSAHSTVHGFKDGINGAGDELAALMTQKGHSVSKQVLWNKACPTNETHHLHLNQALVLQEITGDFSMTDVFVQHRKNWMERNKPEVPQKGVHASMLAIAEEFGQVAHAVNEAMADSTLTERERRDCLKELEDVLDACETLKQALYREGVEKQIHAV